MKSPKKPFPLLIIIALILQGCSDGCENETIQIAKSPNGLWTATVFSRNCGATTAYSAHVYLDAENKPVPDMGNIYRGAHYSRVKAQWEGDKKLIITTDPATDTRLLMKEYSGVNIELIRE